MNYTKGAAGVMKIMNRKKLIISTISIIMVVVANAQISGKSIPQLRQELQTTPSFSFNYQSVHLLTYQLPAENATTVMNYHSSITNYYSYDCLAFFCKIEVKLEKAVKMPIKFRLGDVDYVDRLEGKRQ